MFKKIINTGVSTLNDESLNRKIRISNLIAIITIITNLGYVPATIYFWVTGIALLNFFFVAVSVLNFYLHAKKQHQAAFYISSSYGLIYFTFGSVFYGLSSNLHFFLLSMCLISIVLFENMSVLKTYLGIAIVSFFALAIFMKGKRGLIPFSDEMENAQEYIGIVNLFLLFSITIVFFIFFKRDNILYQKAIVNQKEIIEDQKKEMIDSINYAKRIQYALLAPEGLLQANLPQHFILFKPKDIVSGDFYWAAKKNNSFYLAVCDSTGHGVPGAFMSLLNINFLNEAINERHISAPNEILNHVRKQLIASMEGRKDGMDAILLKIEQINSTIKIEYASANNEPVLIRNNKLIELSKDKMPVGQGEKADSFNIYSMEAQAGDCLYLYTDGYADQFGGEKGKKFKYKQLENILVANNHKSVAEQKLILEKSFNDWKGNLEQVDDVLLIGIKI